jgi:hypothetical protein
MTIIRQKSKRQQQAEGLVVLALVIAAGIAASFGFLR